jgi:hypothetical protein
METALRISHGEQLLLSGPRITLSTATTPLPSARSLSLSGRLSWSLSARNESGRCEHEGNRK